MTGHWIKREVDVHKCVRPTYIESPGVQAGDAWQCDDCGLIWKVYTVWYGDQREPLGPGEHPTILWSRGD